MVVSGIFSKIIHLTEVEGVSGETSVSGMESFRLSDDLGPEMSEGDQARIVLSLLQGLKEKVQEAGASPHIFGKDYQVVGLSNELKNELRLARSYISRLLEQCVGQPARPIEINRHLDRVSKLIATLESTSGTFLKRWISGEIEAEIVNELDSTASEVLRIQERLTCRSPSYGAADFFGKVVRGVDGTARDLFSPALLLVKLLILASMIIAAVLSYFWLTMEREEDLALKITTLSAQISARQELMRRFAEEISRLERAIAYMEENPGGRAERLTLVELQLKVQEAREGREKVSAEISALEKAVAENERRLYEAKNRGFLERLFRLKGSPN